MSVPFSTQQFGKIGKRTRVRLDKIVATQTHLDPNKVRDIARQPADAITTDPLVHPFQGKYYTGDGHHRIGGAIERGDTYTWVRRVR